MHHTRAIVLSGRNIKEADKVFSLLTEELGLVQGLAKSVREESSRMRYVLQEGNAVRISLVRGKIGWRITGVVRDVQAGLPLNAWQQSARARVLQLIERLVAGEETHPILFGICRDAIVVLPAYATKQESEAWELLVAARALHELGYIAPTQEQQVYFVDTAVTPLLLAQVHKEQESLTKQVNEGIAQSQL